MNTLKKTQELLRENGLYAKKGFGQNFLIDDNILENIVEVGNVEEQDTIVEIGPGLGNLTEYLLEKAKSVIAFEIDPDMINILNTRFAENSKLTIINEDIMKVDLSKYIESKKVKVIANLPYYITTPILFKLLEYRNHISKIVIMVQKEVADRLLAKPHSKDYGVLTVNTNYICDVSRVTNVPNTSFIPAPNVTSSVVCLEINLEKTSSIEDEKIFNKLVKAAFSARRKKLINSLVNANVFDINKEEYESMLKDLELSENARAEELSIELYIEFANKIAKLKK